MMTLTVGAHTGEEATAKAMAIWGAEEQGSAAAWRRLLVPEKQVLHGHV